MISCLKQWMGFASVFALRATTDTSLYPSYGLRASVVAASALLLLAAAPASAAGEADTLPKGAAVTVLKASKYCFGNIVEVSGIVLPRDEQQVRPDRFGLKVAEVKADPGDTVTAGETCGEIESTKSVSDLYSPVTGTVTAVNEDIDGAYEAINNDPYGEGWLFEVEVEEVGPLLSADEYGSANGV